MIFLFFDKHSIVKTKDNGRIQTRTKKNDWHSLKWLWYEMRRKNDSSVGQLIDREERLKSMIIYTILKN